MPKGKRLAILHRKKPTTAPRRSPRERITWPHLPPSAKALAPSGFIKAPSLAQLMAGR